MTISYRSSLEEVSPPIDLAGDQDGWHFWKFTLYTKRVGRWDCPVPDDKSTCPGRPPLLIFKERLSGPVLLEGDAVLTELFLLLTLKGPCEVGEVHVVLFKSKKERPEGMMPICNQAS